MGNAKNQFHPMGLGKVLKVATRSKGQHKKEIFEIAKEISKPRAKTSRRTVLCK